MAPPRRPVYRPNRGFRPPPRLMYLTGPKSFAQPVVGASHYQPALGALVRGLGNSGPWPVRARLVHEFGNPADGQAVRVEVDELKVGYLSREDARRFRKWLQRQGRPGVRVECEGVVVRGKGWWANLSVRLDLPVF